jgi:DNA-binding GntR family transcriptional regulator
MSLAEDDPRPKPVQIADELRREIARMKPGAKLPTRKELAERFDVAGQTVQNGLEILRAEGLIFTAGNKGVFVADGDRPTRDVHEELKEIRSQMQALADRVNALEERCGPNGS